MSLSALINRQHTHFATGATRSNTSRRTRLQQLRSAILASDSTLTRALHADLRKSPLEAYASEIGFVLGELDHALRHLDAWSRPRRRPAPPMTWPARAFIQPEPRGVALIVGPWNYPFQLIFSPLVGAIAAGNCAILKPSDLAPHTTRAIADLVQSNFPPEFLTVVQGGRETSEALLRERFDTIFFTGSTTVGRAVMAAAARHLTPVTLELGGKSPCIVCADAPLQTTARRIALGKFLNAGQTCVAPDYVLVDRRIHDPLLQALRQTLGEFYGNNPQQSPDYSRIINRHHLDRLLGLLPSGTLAHGGRHEASDLYLEPTLLTQVPTDAPAMQDEIFGPILPILPFDTLHEALGLIRNRPTPLALYLFTADRSIQHEVLASTRSGGVCLNDTINHMVGKHLPFGGLGDSGLGAYHGKASFDTFTHPRSVLRRSLAFDPKLRYPPVRASLDTVKRLFQFMLGR